MTDIEKKAFEEYPVHLGTKKIDNEEYRIDLNLNAREAYLKACNEYESLPKIRGWVARDSIQDVFLGTGLILHHSKPTRTGGEWSYLTIAMHLPSKMFPEITWESEPVEVELLIRKVESTKQVYCTNE